MVKNPFDEIFAKVKKKYDKEIIVDCKSDKSEISAIPTGCFSLDRAFGCGGIPRGRIIEVYGEESQGKSTLAMFLIAQAQKQGGKGAYVDAEYSFDPDFAEMIGVNTDEDKFVLSQTDSLEETFDVLSALVSSNQFDIIVVDSVASLVPMAEIANKEEGNMMKDTIALQARLLGKGLRLLLSSAAKSKTTIIFINQVRDKVGVTFGNPETTPGGKALKFYSSVRMRVSTGEKFKGSDEGIIGNTLKISMVKNKVGIPFKKAEFDLYYGKGIDTIKDTLIYGVFTEIITKEGNTYSYGGEKLGVGIEKAKEGLSSNLERLEKIRSEIKEKLNAKQ